MATKSLSRRSISSLAERFVYHPQKRVLEPERKAAVLTKSVFVERLPSRVVEYGESLPIDQLGKPVRSIIPEIRRYGSKYQIPERTEFATALHLNMMRILFSVSRVYSSVRDLSVTCKPYVSFSWTRNGDNMQIAGSPGYLVSSKHQIPVFAEGDFIESTEESELDTTGPVSILVDLQSYQTKSDFDYGYLPGSSFPYPHTEIIIDGRGYDTGQLTLRAVSYCFARIAAFALWSGAGSQGKRLINPLSHQAIVTNGRMFAFFCLQLNTLDLESDSGVKNIVWMENNVPLYKRIIQKGKKTTVKGFNPRCVQLWLSMLLHSRSDLPLDISL